MAHTYILDTYSLVKGCHVPTLATFCGLKPTHVNDLTFHGYHLVRGRHVPTMRN